jgi:hypothetical protein
VSNFSSRAQQTEAASSRIYDPCPTAPFLGLASIAPAATPAPAIPAGLLGARALIQFSARTRPLATAGRYDRAAIMAAACAAAPGIMERCGVSRREAMSSALNAWQVAKAAHRAAAH